MDYTFVLCPNIIGLLGLALLLIFTRFNFYLERKKLKLFVAAALCNIAIIVMEVTDYLLAQTPFQGAFLWRRVTSATGFALTPIVPLLIAYISTKRKLPRWILLPAALNLLISFSSILSGHLFYIDECNSYYRGPLFVAMLAFSVFYLLLLIVVSFRGIRSVRSSEAIFLFGIVFTMVLANVLEIVFSFHFVVWNSCGVLLISYYLFLHIQYFKFDPLTGVYNRNMYNYDAENLHGKSNAGVLSFDLNGLKRINDTEGHAQGDAYIIASANLILQCFQNVGRVYRIGGDEFVVLLVNTTEASILGSIALFEQSCKKNKISVACGYSFTAGAADMAQMLRDADNAMYDNKRNRIVNR